MASPYSSERHRKALKIQRSLEKEGNIDDMSCSDADDVDFTKKIYPIGHYIDDRERMIEEMFTVLKGEKLQRILPALLKNYTIEELKADCLVHLLGMSKKRIFAILEGRDLSSSSDSEIEDEETDKQNKSHSDINSPNVPLSKTSTSNASSKEETQRSKKRKSSVKEDKKSKKLNSPCIVISDDELEDLKPLKEERRTVLRLRKERRELRAKIEKKMRKTERRKLKSRVIEIIEDSNDEPEGSKSEDNDEDDDKGKSLLEILELEMRARAIRALLKNTPNADEPVPVSILNIKPEPNSKIQTEINNTIAEVINEETAPDKPRDLSSPTDDVEISEICDILTVTIDDDDVDIDLTTTTEVSTNEEPKTSTTVDEEPKTSTTTGKEQTNKETEICSSTSPNKNAIENVDNRKTTENKNEDADKDNVTWSERWAQSKGVTEVLKSNKLCANIRKRMRFARMLREKQSQVEQVPEKHNLQEDILSSLHTVEESSVAQYELIKSLDKLKSNTVEAHTSSEGNAESEFMMTGENSETSHVESVLTLETESVGEKTNDTRNNDLLLASENSTVDNSESICDSIIIDD